MSQRLNSPLLALRLFRLSGQTSGVLRLWSSSSHYHSREQAGQTTPLFLIAPSYNGSVSGGIFLPVFGTNPVFNGYAGTKWSVLANGQTNYYYDLMAGQFGATPANGPNINAGVINIFNDSGWPFAIGTTYFGFQNDSMYFDPTNWIIYFLSPNSSANALTHERLSQPAMLELLQLDLKRGICFASNLVSIGTNFTVTNGYVGVANTVTIGTTNVNTNERLLVQAAGTSFGPSAQYAEIMIQSTSGNDGPSLRLSAHGGSDFNICFYRERGRDRCKLSRYLQLRKQPIRI